MSEMEREPSVKQLKQKHKTNKREKKNKKQTLTHVESETEGGSGRVREWEGESMAAKENQL